MTSIVGLKQINKGDLLVSIFSSLPLIIWSYFVYNIPLKFLYRDPKIKYNNATFFLTWLCILLPFLVVLYNFYSAQYHSDYNFSTAEITPGWQFCLNTDNISAEERKKGLFATWDLKCGLSQIGLNANIVRDLVTRFYYLSNALFIFVLVIYNSLSVDILKTENITKTMIWCLLFGIIGMLPSIFNTYYLKTFLFNRLISTILSMNIACFFLLILGILIRIKVYK